jgi:hypothetical protein
MGERNIWIELTTIWQVYRRVMKSYIFRDRTACIPLKLHTHFGRTFHLHFQGRKLSQVRDLQNSIKLVMKHRPIVSRKSEGGSIIRQDARTSEL